MYNVIYIFCTLRATADALAVYHYYYYYFCLLDISAIAKVSRKLNQSGNNNIMYICFLSCSVLKLC